MYKYLTNGSSHRFAFTPGPYCAFIPIGKVFPERGRARDQPRRRRAAESRGLDLGRQTSACVPHRAPRPAPLPPRPRRLANYVIMFAAVVLPNRDALRWTQIQISTMFASHFYKILLDKCYHTFVTFARQVGTYVSRTNTYRLNVILQQSKLEL